MIKVRIVLLFFSFVIFIGFIDNKSAEAHRTFQHYRIFPYTPWSYGIGYVNGYYGYRNSYYGYYLYPNYYNSFPLQYSYADPYYFSRYSTPIYYSPLPSINLPLSSPVYIQRSETNFVTKNNYWYYCEEPAGYYPDVMQCQTDWIKVPPRSAE